MPRATPARSSSRAAFCCSCGDDVGFAIIRGKTTGFLSLANEINAKGDAVAFYCSLETAQEFPDPAVGLPLVYRCICGDARRTKLFPNCAPIAEDAVIPSAESILSDGIKNLLSSLAESAGKPLVVFFDEVDCLSAGTLVTFLRQLRNGRISCASPGTFPSTVALIGMRDIRDYKAKIRPDSETLGSASPFNVVTKAMTLRSFTEEELRALYRQHTDETGQVFEEEALKLAWEFSQGQPHLVNALARWCVEEIHKDDQNCRGIFVGVPNEGVVVTCLIQKAEGWLVVFDPDLTKPWDDKISAEDIAQDGKTIHPRFVK